MRGNMEIKIMDSKGLTIIEIIVVIAVLGVIATIVRGASCFIHYMMSL